MRVLSILVVFGLALVTALGAAAQEPFGWRYSTVNGRVELELIAYEELSRVHLVISEGDADSAPQTSHDRSVVRAGERWKVTRPAPQTQDYWRAEVTGELRGVDFNAWYAFPVGPPPTIDFELVRYRFVDGENWIEVRPDAPTESAFLRVHGESGQVLYEGERPLAVAAGEEARIDIDVSEKVLVVDVTLHATSGATREYRYTPWELRTEARALHFETGVAEIREEDHAALDAAYQLISDAVTRLSGLISLELYIGGYTDSVGRPDANRELSLRRAQSIGRYLRGKGIGIPIYVQGFGEAVPAVDVGDEVESAENRRAVFLLRAGAPEASPVFPASHWSRLR